ncbi:MAG: hypothetical protein ACP5G1_01535 [Nanopusillaceae archaeon]
MKAKLFFEAFSNDKDKLKEILEEVVYKNVSQFKNFTIIDKKVADPIEKEIATPDKKTIKGWSSYLEIRADFNDFESLLDFVLSYTPSKIELEDIKEMRVITKEGEYKYNKMKVEMMFQQISQAIITKIATFANVYLAQMRKPPQEQQNTQKPNLNLKIPKEDQPK